MNGYIPPEKISIQELNLPVETLTILQKAGIKNVKELCEMDEQRFWSIPSMNKEHHSIIEQAVEQKLKSIMNSISIKKPTALHVAQYFISRSNPNTEWYVSHLKLQKLVYYAQAWHLAFYGETLFDEPIEAWVHGPVVRSVYERFRRYGYSTLNPHQNYLIDEETGKLFDHPVLKEYYGDIISKEEVEEKDKKIKYPFLKRLFFFKK